MSPAPLSQTVDSPLLVRWGAAAVAAGVLGVLLLVGRAGFSQAVGDRNDRAVAAARMVERGLTRTLESVETSLAAVGEEARIDIANGTGALAATRRRMAEAIRFAPHIRQLAIVRGNKVLADSNGRDAVSLDMERLALSGTAIPGLNQGLLIGHEHRGRFLPIIGDPAADHQHRSLLPVALVAAAGESSGPLMIVAALNTAYLGSFFEDTAFGRDGVSGLLRQDGTPLLGPAGMSGWQDILDSMLSSGAEEGFASGAGWPGTATVIRLSTRYPVAVFLKLFHRDTLADWADSNRSILTMLGTITLAAVAVMILLLRHTLQRRALRSQVRLLVEAVEQSPVVVLITNAGGRIDYVNPSFSRLFGYSFGEAKGSSPKLLDSGQNPPGLARSLWRSIAAGHVWKGEFLNRAKDGSVLCVSSTISAVKDSQGRTTHYIGIMADVTEAKRADRERESLIQQLARANQDLHRFAEISAHHLQEPTRRLVSFSQRTVTRLQGRIHDDEAVESLNFIAQQAGRLRDLLRDIQLYLAADVPLAPQETVDATRVAHDVVARHAHLIDEVRARILVTDLPPVRLDSPRLTDLFGILLDNALRYRRPDILPEISISGEMDAGAIRYRVSDNGPGIAPEFRDRVFEVFERLPPASDPAGTGVGLAIARRIVESCAGRIWIDETPGGGTTVIIEFTPAATP
jgi:PAS domain S-box-containing protein